MQFICQFFIRNMEKDENYVNVNTNNITAKIIIWHFQKTENNL